ncbi:gdsl esterase/lipase, partial [Quercus suber]
YKNIDYIVFLGHVNLQQLYDLGCRKMMVVGLPTMGCLPIQITLKYPKPINRKCIEHLNADSQSYNHKLVNLLSKLQAVLPGSKFAYADINQRVINMINNPQKYGKLIQPRTGNSKFYGFVETSKGCCGTGYVKAGTPCNSITPTCERDSRYLFFDCIHPSEATNHYISKNIVSVVGKKDDDEKCKGRTDKIQVKDIRLTFHLDCVRIPEFSGLGSVMDFHFFYVYYDGETYYHELNGLSYQGSNQKQKCVKVKRGIGLMNLKRRILKAMGSVMDFHFFYVYYDGEMYYHELNGLSYQGSNQKQKCVKVKRGIGLMNLKRRILKAMGLDQSRHNIFIVYRAPQLVVGTQVVYKSLQLLGGTEVKMMWEVIEQMVVKGFVASELYVTVEPTIVVAGEGSQHIVLDGTIDEHIESIPLRSYQGCAENTGDGYGNEPWQPFPGVNST